MFLRRIAALALIALLGVSTTAGAQAPPPSAPFVMRTLANGMNVVVVEDHAAAVAQTQMWYRFGSLNETPGKTGLAHALEHMFFRGTPSLSGAGLDDISARLGAQVNAQTQNDTTHYYYVLPSDKVELAIHLEADRLANLSIKESDWKLEKGAVLAEIEGDYSQPFFKLYDAVRRAAFPKSPYALTALGEKADVQNASAADLRRYFQQWYGPNNATLVVTGDVRPSDVFGWAQRYFGPISRKTLPAQRQPALPAAPSATAISVKADYPFAVYDLAYRTEGDLDRGTAATNVLASVIGNQRAPFYKALVESQLTFGYQAFNDTTLHSGLLHMFFVLAPGKSVDDVRKAFEDTLVSLRSTGIAPDLIDAAKRSVASQAVYARDSIAGLGDRYGYALGVAGRDPASFDADTAAVTVADVNAVLNTKLTTPSVIGTLVPQRPKPGAPSGGKTDSSISDNFSSRAPSGPIVQPSWVKSELAKPLGAQSKTKPTQYTLSNGIRLYVQEVHANPTVSISGSIESSPAFVNPAKAGLSGIVSELLSFGSAKYDFAAQRKVADDLAASLNVGQSFSAHGLAKDLETLLDVVADGERHPTFPNQYVTLVQQQTIAGLSQRMNDPDYLAGRAFDTLLLDPSDPALIEATEASVKAITPEDLSSYTARYYRPDLTRIVVVGDVDPKNVLALVEAKFGDWKVDGAKPDTSQRPVPLRKAETKHVAAVRENVSVRLGGPTLDRRNPDFYALNLLNSVLGGGGGFDTRLMHEVRVKRGLVYGINSSLALSRDRGSFQISFSANPAKVRPALAVVREQLRRLQREPVGPAELAQAKTKLIAGQLVGEESTSAIVAGISNIAANDLPLDYYQTFAQRYKRLTSADLLRVAKRYIPIDNLVEVSEGPAF